MAAPTDRATVATVDRPGEETVLVLPGRGFCPDCGYLNRLHHTDRPIGNACPTEAEARGEYGDR